MKAMVFAAGRGTRLRPLTDTRPKGLAEVGGRTLLEIVLCRLREAGVREVVINLHHLGVQIEDHVARHDGFGLRVAFSREHQLLDTGGGLKQAAWFFDDNRPFLLHNVDVLSDIDLGRMMREHEHSGALATLAAMRRPTARPLLFDAAGLLCGRVMGGTARLVRPPEGEVEPMGFCGIHAASPALLGMLSETGAFSIVESYLRLAAEGEPVRVFCADGARWRDAGRPEDLIPL